MLSYSHKHLSGVSLLEILLVLMLVAAGMALGFNQYFQYVRTKEITQIQQSVERLLQAGSAYYYASCTPSFLSEIPQQVSLKSLQAVGLLADSKEVYNPWGDQPFEVWIISGNPADEIGGPPYLIQIRVTFAGRSTAEIGQVAKLLSADNWNGGSSLFWTQLPSQVLKNRPISVRSPGGWVPAISGTYNGGKPLSSNLEVMKGDLAYFSKYEAGRVQGGFTCPD